MMELPLKDLCRKSIKTKENLIEIISTSLLERFTSKRMQNRLLIASKSTCLEESHLGIRIKRWDLVTNYEEANFIIPQQFNNLLEEGKEKLMVLSADTDVFVLL